MYCDKCKRIISETKPFCRYCGARTAAPFFPGNKDIPSPAKPAKGNNRIIAILAAAVGILAVTLVVVVLSGRTDISSDNNSGIPASESLASSDDWAVSTEHTSSPAEVSQPTPVVPTISPTQYIPREGQSVEFVSPEFEACIRQLLNKSYGDITVGECESVTELFILGEYCFDTYTNYFDSGKGNNEDHGDGSFYYNGSRHQRSRLDDISDIEYFPNLVSVSICLSLIHI